MQVVAIKLIEDELCQWSANHVALPQTDTDDVNKICVDGRVGRRQPQHRPSIRLRTFLAKPSLGDP